MTEQQNANTGREAGHRSRDGRRRRRSRHRWSRRSKVLLALLALCLVAIFFMVLFFGINLYSLNKEAESLRVNLRSSEQQLRTLVPEVERLRRDLADSVMGRIPQLRPLRYDQVLRLDQGYVKHIVFTEIRHEAARHYEFKMVLENETPYTVWPKVRLYIFNDVGIQIGQDEIGYEKAGEDGFGSLGPGEVRSHSASIAIDVSQQPAYFLVSRAGRGLDDREGLDSGASGAGIPLPEPSDGGAGIGRTDPADRTTP